MQFWAEREPIEVGDPVPFSIHENDKNTIRNNIVEATISAPEPIRCEEAPISVIFVILAIQKVTE